MDILGISVPTWPLWIIVFCLVLLLIAAILGFIFWISMIVDAIKRPMNTTEKAIWLAILLFSHDIGALIYYFAIKRSNR